MSKIKKAMAWLGLVEDYEDDYADEPDAQAPSRQPASVAASRPEQSNVRRIAPTRVPERGPEPPRGAPASAVRSVTSGKVHVTEPSTFNDVEEIGERFRNGIPVIMNLAGANEGVAKRLLDFASGLIYGLDGRIERVGDRVFLLTPLGVDVSTEERRQLTERGFFNQA
ncbi:hypothetical protein BH20ACT9_BH20ACT9_06610 [soil metagenome]